MDNIEAFNIAVAEIFGKCYQVFPMRVVISDISLGDTIRFALNENASEDIDMSELEYTIARESVNWLIQAGYLWHRGETELTTKGVTLTPKGLEVLNAIPDGLKSKVSIGEQLSKGVKSLGKETAISIVKAGLNYGSKIIINSI